MKTEMIVTGLAEAEEMIALLHKCGAGSVGAIFKGAQRDDGKNNADVVRYLADGVTRADGTVIKRDLGPSQEDADAAAAIYMKRVADRLRLIARKAAAAAAGAGKPTVVTKAQAAMNAEFVQASALRQGCGLVAERMASRANSGLTVQGGSESGAERVERKYALRRQRAYQVPPDAVYKATGQLLRNFGPGFVRLVKKPPWLGSVSKFLGLGSG